MTPRAIDRVADNIRAAASDAGLSVSSISEATGIPAVDLTLHPEDLTVDDLGTVGGFLRVSPSVFLEGVAA